MCVSCTWRRDAPRAGRRPPFLCNAQQRCPSDLSASHRRQTCGAAGRVRAAVVRERRPRAGGVAVRRDTESVAAAVWMGALCAGCGAHLTELHPADEEVRVLLMQVDLSRVPEQPAIRMSLLKGHSRNRHKKREERR